MSSGILFLSDLHYSKKEEFSQFKENDDNSFYQNLENKLIAITQEKKINFKYIVIAGDFVERGKKAEYKVVLKILNKLCENFSIEKRNVLLIPGNHDIDRAALDVYCDNVGIVKSNDAPCCEKIKNYLEFYCEFKQINEKIDVEKAILDYIYVEESQVLFIGLNTLTKLGTEDGCGWVNLEKLKKEIKEKKEEYNNIFVVSHHSFVNSKEKEIASIENATVVKDAMHTEKINTYFYGHHHTSERKVQSGGEYEDGYLFCELGSLGKIIDNKDGHSHTNSFIIGECKADEIVVEEYIYFQEEWINFSNKNSVNCFPTIRKEQISTNEVLNLPEANSDNKEEDLKKEIEDINICDDTEYLFEFLRKEGNYKEGHFHWKDGVKTLGWINIASFLGNIELMGRVKKTIIDLLNNEKFINVSAVVGYGMEGNIIGSSLVDYWIDTNRKYYFYPSVHKKNEYIDFEKALWNDYNEIDEVLIICDLMPSNNYVDEIIKSNSRLQACKAINILSLFYNKNAIEKEEKYKGSAIIRKISLAEVDITVCNKNADECLVYSKELSKIYTL